MKKVKTIFISDVHLGTMSCKSEYLLDFLKSHTCDKLVLVGDIIDGWRLKSRFYWTEGHNRVVQHILKMSKTTQVIYVIGNHDEFLRNYAPLHAGSVEIVKEYIHNDDTWVIHGDEFDGVTKYHRWVAVLGDYAYQLLLRINIAFNYVRQRFGFGYWSLSAYLKYKVKSAVNFIFEFENALSKECTRRGYKRVICGHIHHAEIKAIGDVEYCNCGDWVESCTALVETKKGEYQIVTWVEGKKSSGQ